MKSELNEFAIIFLFLVGGAVLVTVALTLSSMLRPHRPNKEKLTVYECGEDTIGETWGQFNNRFYVVAMIFVLFEVELIFLFPWALVYTDPVLNQATQSRWSWFALAEGLIFIAILALAYIYAWAKGYLDWIKPEVKQHTFEGKVPMKMYESVNEKYLERTGVK
jgi:NADH-quinone oxidoreductase subunit A